MNTKALFHLTYGLYLLTAKDNDKDGGCIINTAVQVANNPARLSIAVNKNNLTHDMVLATGKCNISVLTEDAPFALFQHFGMQSARDVDKFAGYADAKRSGNGLMYLTKYANAFLSLEVLESMDLGSHTLFIAELADAEVLSDGASVTYEYYQNNIKTKAPAPAVKKGWKCKVCGYVYEGEQLPEDFVCPWCKHGPEDFEYFEEPIPAAEPVKWICTVCSYVHEGDTPPEKCPICKVGPDKFKKL